MPQPAPPAPPPDPRVVHAEKIANDTHVESALNDFIAAKQAALFDSPDAFYRTEGEDAIHAAPVAAKNLNQLRPDLLDGLGNDYQRQRLGDVLDAQMQLTRDGMARHVAEQSLAWQRGVAQDRIAILTKEAAHHHNDTDLVDALGHAAATAARAHSRVGDGPPGGEAEDAAAATARSGVLGAAIRARLDRGNTQGADALFTQVQDQLDPAHAAPLQSRIETVQRLTSAKDYADGIVSATPAASLEEIDALHQAAIQQAEADHTDDPRQQTLARHFLNQAFDARRQELQQGNTGSADAIEEWLNTPGADGGPQRNLPPPAVLNRLDDNALDDLVFRLGRDDRGVGLELLPYKPSLSTEPPGATVGDRTATGRDPNIVLAQAITDRPSPDHSAPSPERNLQNGSAAAAADIATQSARPGVNNYGGRCAAAVINSLREGGYDVPNVPLAKNMGPGLHGAGFEEIVPSTPLPIGSQHLPDDYTPRTGDVIVIDNPNSSGNAGHTAIYNGTDWVSDTVQSGANPYARGTSTISIYRHP